MKLNVRLAEVYPHPVEKVWRALTEPEALRSWLMDNDFEPRIGKRFTLRGRANPERNECEVLVLEPPHRMVWSWICHAGDPPTEVEFRLEAIDGGTRLTLAHTGEIEPIMGARYTEGWPGKMAALRASLSAEIQA